MEVTYADEAHGGAFSQDNIPDLTQISLGNECFSGSTDVLNGAISLPGSTWTMGATFAQSAGLPLKDAGSSNAMLSRYDSFFEGLVGLGDILESEGYVNALLTGSDAAFSGRRGYFQTHGDFDIRDYDYAAENGLIPEGHRVFWGKEDLYLFEIAKQTVVELASSGVPFNLTMLTVNTHFEDGYVCDLCGYEFGDDRYANLILCSSRQVAEFLFWLQGQDFYEDTSVVICGGHPTMDKDFCESVPESNQRKTYTAIVNAAVEPMNPDRARTFSTMDLLLTTLAATGVSIEDERLGLGTNLFSSKDTLIESFGYDECYSRLLRASDFLSRAFVLGNSPQYLDSLARDVTVEVRTNTDEKTVFVLHGFEGINYRTITDAYAVVIDSRTGESVSRNLMPAVCDYRVNPFDYRLEYPCGEDDLSYLLIDFFINVEGIGDYRVARFGGRDGGASI